MAQVWDSPTEIEAQPEDTPAVVATGTGMSAFDVMPSAPRRPLPRIPARWCVWSVRRALSNLSSQKATPIPNTHARG